MRVTKHIIFSFFLLIFNLLSISQSHSAQEFESIDILPKYPAKYTARAISTILSSDFSSEEQLSGELHESTWAIMNNTFDSPFSFWITGGLHHSLIRREDYPLKETDNFLYKDFTLNQLMDALLHKMKITISPNKSDEIQYDTVAITINKRVL